MLRRQHHHSDRGRRGNAAVGQATQLPVKTTNVTTAKARDAINQ
ncbi:hypothetical protein [Nostoc sp. C052]|nr:hypothetical protein [Nostoc sp. C052]